MVSALAVFLMTACATRTEYVEVRPDCTPPPVPALPELSADDLAPLSDGVYYDVIERDARLQDWALEMRAMLRELCNE